MNVMIQQVGQGAAQRGIAYLRGTATGSPGLVWLSGFKSDMVSTKASAVAAFAEAQGAAMLRFDYSGHGQSDGDFAEGTISAWLEETLALITAQTSGPQILVGSSMGGWLALLAARALAARGEAGRLAGMVLIAPAVDFTQALLWPRLPEAVRHEIMTRGVWLRENAYGPEPMPISKKLILDGAQNLLMTAPLRSHGPVHILQGMRDEDVPFSHAQALVALLAHDEVTLTLVPDGDHRLSRDEDIALLLATIAGMRANTRPA
ncbi:MAG: alpha/beta hydrolase [Hyphomicrobiales bacterium]|nr:alpha/beta hydrolase [Hyphomicrobiales bacterium]